MADKHTSPFSKLLIGLLCLSMLLSLTACSFPWDAFTGGDETTQAEEMSDLTEDTVEESEGDIETEATRADEESTFFDESIKEDVTEEAPTEDIEADTTTDPESEIDTEPEEPFYPENTPRAGMPRVDIRTEGGAAITSKEEYVRSTISISGCDDVYVKTDCPAGIRVRGNTTGARPKKPYRIKFDNKQTVLGINDGERFKDWCLLADYYDLSMLRTWTAFSFADVLLEGKYYSSDCVQVEVFLNGQYMGVYLLCEQTEIDDDRVNVYEKQDGETSVEIGYLMIGQGGRTDEPDTVSMYPSFWVTDRNGDQMYFDQLNVALSGSGYTDEQKAYVKNYVTAITKVMYQALYADRYYGLDSNGNPYHLPPELLAGMTKEEKQIYTISAVFDLEAAARMCVLEEIVKNQDIATFNLYIDLSPNGDRRLTLAAPWDYDFAMGNNNRAFLRNFDGRHATALNNNHSNLFYVMLSTTDWFDQMCREIWQDKYDDLQDVAKEILVRTYRYTEAYNRDWERWGASNRPELESFQNFEDMASFKDHSDAGWFLYTWLTSRMRYIDRIWGEGYENVETPDPSYLQVDLTDAYSLTYLNGAKRCSYQATKDGLYLTLSSEARDPYFYVDYTGLPDVYSSEKYHILEIEYMIPETNSLDWYVAEFYLCTGDRWGAESDVSVVESLGLPDGEYHTLRIDLSQSPYWKGIIRKIRIDYFDTCAAGDEMYIKSVKLLKE